MGVALLIVSIKHFSFQRCRFDQCHSFFKSWQETGTTCWIHQFPFKQLKARTALGWETASELVELQTWVQISILLRGEWTVANQDLPVMLA